MNPLLKNVIEQLPEDKIEAALFEGANIVLYTKHADFFLESNGLIRDIVNKVKKRIELRPDPSITKDQTETEKIIREVLPKETEIVQILFDEQRSQVVIDVEKPGLAIGKQGMLLKEIKERTLWIPFVRRTPALRSKIVQSVRSILFRESEHRRKFLNKVGQDMYEDWSSNQKIGWIRATWLGAGRQVGRSSILLQTPKTRILLDCGVDVAAKNSDAYPILDAPEFKIEELDAVIISHAHLDHMGFLPYLFKCGYRGPVYCTPPTRDLMGLMLMDYVKIMHSENKDLIFDKEDVQNVIKHTIALNYEEVTDIAPDMRITLYNAGHILGSAMIHLHIGNGLHNLLYSGDMKYGKTTLLDPAHTKFNRVETIICEATYAGKDKQIINRDENDEEFVKVVEEVTSQGGKVLVPVIGVGRAQEIMLTMEQLMNEGKMKKIPVFVDGMIWDINAIHTAYPEYLSDKVRKQIFHSNENPFLSENFKEVGSGKERQKIIEEEGPCVIIATSGMLVGGPSVQYLKKLSDNPKNGLIFVVYQGAGSLGRRIQQGEREIKFVEGSKQEIVTIQCRVETISGFSGHSNREELMNFLNDCSPRPRRMITNHGELSHCIDLATSTHKKFRMETTVPRNLDSVRIR